MDWDQLLDLGVTTCGHRVDERRPDGQSVMRTCRRSWRPERRVTRPFLTRRSHILDAVGDVTAIASARAADALGAARSQHDEGPVLGEGDLLAHVSEGSCGDGHEDAAGAEYCVDQLVVWRCHTFWCILHLLCSVFVSGAS